MIVITKDSQAEIDGLNNKIVEMAQLLAKANAKIATLTEQLRLANEDAERLAEYVGHKRTCTWLVTRSDVTPRCGCKLSDVMYLHEERIAQER